MQKEIKIVKTLLILGLILALSSWFIKRYNSTTPALRPFANSVDIFSLFRKYEKPKSTVYGYLPYWNIEDLEYLQMDKITDIAYFGIYLNGDGNFMTSTYDDVEEISITEPGYNNWKNNEDIDKLIEAAKKYDVRFALTIIAHSDDENDNFLNCKGCWDIFLANLVRELDSKGIKDVNLNFEYYEYTEKEYADKFVDFTRFVNENLDKKYGDSKVIVSAFADSNLKERVSSNVAELAQVSDGIFIMGYDFHRPASTNSGPLAPLKGGGKYYDYDIQTTVADFLKQAPPSKIILGVPYYGYNWVVESTEPYSKRLEGNDDIGFSQSQSYASVMDTIIEVNPEIKWNEDAQSPYFHYISPETGSLRQVYYENADSLRYKYRLAKENSLAGVGIWALGYDGGYTELWNLLYEEFVR